MKIEHGDVVKQGGCVYVVLKRRGFNRMVGMCLYKQSEEAVGTINNYERWVEEGWKKIGNINEVLELLRKHYASKSV